MPNALLPPAPRFGDGPVSSQTPRGRVAGIVLAGGESSRMGRPKALLDLGGSTFLQTIAGRLLEAGVGDIVVVAGSAAEAIRRHGNPGSQQLVVNTRPELGQLSSLQAGMAALQAGTPAAICCLVDHPLVTAATYTRLFQAWRLSPGSIVRPVCGGKHGHPIVIDRRFFAQLLALPPEATMRAIIQQNDEDAFDVEVDDPGIHMDVDTPQDYERLLAAAKA